MDLTLAGGMANLRDMIAWLGREKLRPLGIEADRAGAPLPPEHPFFREVLSLGLTAGFVGQLRGDAREDDGRPRSTARRAVVMAEEAAYWDRGMATSLPGPGLGGAPLVLLGTPEQRARFLGIFEDREVPRWGAFAMSEPGAGSDVAAIRTTARRDGDGWVLDGEKVFISNGARAAWVVVWASVDRALGRAGHRAFVVERGTPGFRVARIEKKMGLTASETAALVFEGCRVPGDDLLGGEETYRDKGGFRGAMRSFDMTRPMVAAMAVGIGRAALDEATRFAREHLGGASSARRQRVGERLARMRRRIDAGRLLAWRAAWLADQGRQNSLEAAMAKASCAPVALEAASLGLDVLGEAGAGHDHLIEKLWRDAKALDIVEGTGQIQRVVIARRLVGYGQDGEARAEGVNDD
jgi:acyl-CoA dehydrogenase